jgi:NADPH2:quinone reductase
MKALLSVETGGPETLVLQDLPVPQPGAGEVVVAMRACGVNYPDALLIAGRYQISPPRPFAPGGEIAGVVSAVGPGVQGIAAGERVLAMVGWGGMAEAVKVAAKACVPLPATMSFEHAAALMATYGTVHYGLSRRARLQAGESLLVLGAAGGIGLAAVELGRARGARVIAAVSSQEKLDLALSRGAASGFVYPTGAEAADAKALSQLFKQHCGAPGVDVIADPVGDVYAEPALRSIAWGGRYLVIGFAGGAIPKIPLNLPLLKGCDIQGVLFGAHAERDPAEVKQEVRELFELHARGAIRPHVSATYPLARGGEAIAAVAARRALGKLVVVANS